MRGDWISPEIVETIHENSRSRFIEEVEIEIRSVINSCLRKKYLPSFFFLIP